VGPALLLLPLTLLLFPFFRFSDFTFIRFSVS
jgi:hypothetical protein